MEEKNIIITAIDLKDDYEVIDTLCETERLSKRYPKGEYLNQILTITKERLRRQCQELGGDAIIGCHIFCFDYFFLISGTAVKIKSKS